MIEMIIAYRDNKALRKRACINCGLRDLCGAGSRCGKDGHYIGYCDTWDDWCKNWRKDRRPLGTIGVYKDGIIET